MWFIIGLVLITSIYILIKFHNRQLLETVTYSNRGTRSERDLVLRLLKHRIPAQTIFHDLYLKKSNGEFSQIDLVVVTKVGIIVFEVKDFSGWIFGNGNHSQWTQVLAYGKSKFRFYNPIMQNNGHIKHLKKQLRQFESIPFYSVVVFYGDCVLKDISFVPEGTFLVKSKRVFEVMKIIANNTEAAPYTDKHEVLRVLQKAALNGGNVKTQIEHNENIEGMLGKDRIFD